MATCCVSGKMLLASRWRNKHAPKATIQASRAGRQNRISVEDNSFLFFIFCFFLSGHFRVSTKKSQLLEINKHSSSGSLHPLSIVYAPGSVSVITQCVFPICRGCFTKGESLVSDKGGHWPQVRHMLVLTEPQSLLLQNKIVQEFLQTSKYMGLSGLRQKYLQKF